jgi:hypothetical protein
MGIQKETKIFCGQLNRLVTLLTFRLDAWGMERLQPLSCINLSFADIVNMLIT